MASFHLCAYGDCRKRVFALTKYGEGYCERHTLMIVDAYNMSEFWPHYHELIEIEMKNRERHELIEKRKRSLKPSMDMIIYNEISKRRLIG